MYGYVACTRFRARNRRVHGHDVVRLDGSVRVYSPSSGPVKIQYFNILPPNLCLPITHAPNTHYCLKNHPYYSQLPQKHVQQRPTVESSTWVMQRRMVKTGSRVSALSGGGCKTVFRPETVHPSWQPVPRYALATQGRIAACCFQPIVISGWLTHKFNTSVFY